MPKTKHKVSDRWWKNIAHLVSVDVRSRSRIAIDADIKPSHLRAIVAGEYKQAMIGTIERLCRTLGVSLSCVFYSETPPTPSQAYQSVCVEKKYAKGE